MVTNFGITNDGRGFSTLEEFCQLAGTLAKPDQQIRTCTLDWLNDVLSWPFFAIGVRYDFVWRNSEVSRQRLGYTETIRQLEARGVERFPNEFTGKAVSDIHAARRGEGPTVFDWLVEIFENNAQFVELRLQ
jgi:hypothetical protein